ncbi:MAG: arsenite oxidase small subunit [Candidatus Entotheonella factor]|uniref:Arsenite oxidase small subunit n=1 Tax=Entotheonella factor TaxID=1429438 RepID=W4LHH9_ENTF1|nr:MAG: arsenite oxidase small subunit [Candidatus Entotheonella factor]
MTQIRTGNGHGDSEPTWTCLTRRRLLQGGIAATTVLLAIPGLKQKAVAAQLASYPRQKIGQLSQLRVDQPLIFSYPDAAPSALSMAIKLGERAGGGIGPQQDVVAFNSLCTHMGGPMIGSYQKQDKALGPCPFHQTTFDLTRHGMVISGHATESLPQVLLELEGDDIYAVGVLGLIFGRHDNLVGQA